MILSIFYSASDNKWTVFGRVTGSLLSRLDRISIVLMKNAKNIIIEIKILKFQKIPDSEKSLASSRELIVLPLQKKG